MATKTPKAPADDTALTIADFAAVVRRHTSKTPGDAAGVRASLVRVARATPPVYSDEDIQEYLEARQQAVKDLIDAYLGVRLTGAYPKVDPKLFDLKRYLVFDRATDKLLADKTAEPKRAAGQHVHEVDLFVLTPLDEREKRLASCAYNRRGRSDSVRITITADPGPVPHSIVMDGQAARGAYLRAAGDLCADPDLAPMTRGREFPQPTLELAWIPAAGSLKFSVSVEPPPAPRNLDPALLLKVGADRYLVATYDIPGEKSYEAFLKEFTAGPTAAVLAKNKKAGNK